MWNSFQSKTGAKSGRGKACALQAHAHGYDSAKLTNTSKRAQLTEVERFPQNQSPPAVFLLVDLSSEWLAGGFLSCCVRRRGNGDTHPYTMRWAICQSRHI